MNKTVSINLNGLLFNLEEAAYDKLSAYLTAIRRYFEHTEGRDEMLRDVEARIAELFTEKLKNKQVILLSEVEEIIAVLGQPEEYADSPEPEEANQRPMESSDPRRLFRDPDEAMLAGVCSGIGYFFGIDPVWLRIAFLVAFFFGGSGLILYLILWIAMPKANTRSEKLQMRGQPVTLETLEKGVKEEIDRINRKAGEVRSGMRSKFNGAGLGAQLGKFITEMAMILGKAFGNIIAWIGRFIGFVFLMAGVFAFFIWLMLVLGFPVSLSMNGTSLDGNTVKALLNLIFSQPWQTLLFIIGISVLVLSPVLGIFFSGARLIFPKRFSYRWPGALTAGLFIIGVITCIVCGAFVIRDFRSQGKIIQSVPLNSFSSDTIRVMSNPGAISSLKRSMNFDGWEIYFNDGDQYILGKVRLDIERADVDKPILKVISKAKGSSKKAALESAENLRYFVKQKGDTLLFNPWFRIREGNHWRGQDLEFQFKVPQKTHFSFDETMIRQVDDLYVPFELEGLSQSNLIWKPGQDKMECLNCPESD